jgi:hypothetical protein
MMMMCHERVSRNERERDKLLKDETVVGSLYLVELLQQLTLAQRECS